jgi:tRNA(Ile)-lysidine synthase
MGRLGPWDSSRRVAVAVSGGADSLALALLAKAWGDPVAFIVDHGLRVEAAAEAAWARDVLTTRGIPATILQLRGLRPGAASARAARYAALSAACRAAGLVDLLLGHHAGDQAETIVMRQRRGSGPDGLAGMAALVETDDIRLVRPLLDVDPRRLREVVAAAGLVPVEDPTNTDLRSTRARLRQEIGTDRADLLAVAAAAGRTRVQSEAGIARELAERVQFFPEGFALLSPGPVGERTLASLLRSLSGRRFPVGHAGSLAACPRAATVAGVQVQPAGRLGPGWLLVREAAAMQPAIPADAGRVWDGRWRTVEANSACMVGALGDTARTLRRVSRLPFSVLRTLPAFWRNSALSDVPHLDYTRGVTPGKMGVIRHAGLPASGASFLLP